MYAPVAIISLLAVLFAGPADASERERTGEGTAPRKLTVERIFGQPSLSGMLALHPMWVPDSRRISFFEVIGAGKTAQLNLVAMDAVSGVRTVLVPAAMLKQIEADSKPGSATSEDGLPYPEYRWAPAGNALVFFGPHAITWVDLKSQTPRILFRSEQTLSHVDISPNGRYVSFVYEHNIWRVSVATTEKRAVTNGGSEEIRNGEVDWSYSEELKTGTGYWWSPDSSAIAYLEIDERGVDRFSLPASNPFDLKERAQRYAIPGRAIPKVRVLVTRIDGGESVAMRAGTASDAYLPRVTWLQDSRRLAIEWLNRSQTNLKLLIADVASGSSTIVLSEADPYWINVGDDPVFLSDGRRFLWSSERTGYRHLFLYELSGKRIGQLTTGEWEVEHVAAVDEARRLVYFTATEKSPLERHLYSVRFDGSAFSRITTKHGTHVIRFNSDATMFLDTYSNANTPPRQDVFRADGSPLATLDANPAEELRSYHFPPLEFFSIRSHDGVLLNCSMIKPAGFVAGKRYPVLIYVEGGPGTQAVVNAWRGTRYLWRQLMAQKGFVVFSLDNRGSGGRGHIFEEAIHYRLGAQELSDQRDGAHWLKTQPFVDPDRIGIWGWGYGGQLALHALFEMPQTFRAGFAGAPITDWRFYDAVFSERYLGMLPLAEESYQESSPIKNAEKLKGTLLVAAGTGDARVHYAQTLALIDELMKAGKYVEVITLPGRGDVVTDSDGNTVLWNRVTEFFINYLSAYPPTVAERVPQFSSSQKEPRIRSSK